MFPQYDELRPTNGRYRLACLGHPIIFQRLSRLGSVSAQHSGSGRQPNFAALNRGRQLYSSRWASAHISSCATTVYKTVRAMLSVRCLSCLSVCLSVLSVTFVHCGQTVGRLKMKLGIQVGLVPGHIMLDGDPSPLPKGGGGGAPNFRPISVVAKWLHGSRCHLIWRKDLAQATLC